MDARNGLTLAYLRSHPREAARTLERLVPDIVAQLITEIEPAIAAGVLNEMLPSHAAAALERLPRRAAAHVLEHMAVTRIARLVPKFGAAGKEWLDMLPLRKKLPVRRILKYPAQTVGALMEAPHLVLPDMLTAADALRRIRRDRAAPDGEICVVDPAQRLVGLVPIGALLKAHPGTPLHRLMRRWPPSLHARARVPAAAASPAWRHYRTLPVVEGNNLLVGSIDYERLVDESRGEDTHVDNSDPFSVAMDLARLYWSSAVTLLESLSATPARRKP